VNNNGANAFIVEEIDLILRQQKIINYGYKKESCKERRQERC
jgi:hypothetical protein